MLKKLCKYIDKLISTEGTSSCTRFVFLFGSIWLFVIMTVMLFFTEKSLADIGKFFVEVFIPLSALKLWQNSQENKTNI